MMGSPVVGREPPIPLTRASILKPFMSFLRGLGAPVAREILKADLPQWGFEDYDVLVPTRALTAFVANAGRSQSIDNFGLRMSRRCGMQGLEPGLRSAICSAPTLYAGLNQLCAGARHRSTRVNVWLKHDHDTLYLCHRGSFPIEETGPIRDVLVGSRYFCCGRARFSRPELVSQAYGRPTARRCRLPAL